MVFVRPTPLWWCVGGVLLCIKKKRGDACGVASGISTLSLTGNCEHLRDFTRLGLFLAVPADDEPARLVDHVDRNLARLLRKLLSVVCVVVLVPDHTRLRVEVTVFDHDYIPASRISDECREGVLPEVIQLLVGEGLGLASVIETDLPRLSIVRLEELRVVVSDVLPAVLREVVCARPIRSASFACRFFSSTLVLLPTSDILVGGTNAPDARSRSYDDILEEEDHEHKQSKFEEAFEAEPLTHRTRK